MFMEFDLILGAPKDHDDCDKWKLYTQWALGLLSAPEYPWIIGGICYIFTFPQLCYLQKSSALLYLSVTGGKGALT